jgi:hypothetical protein
MPTNDQQQPQEVSSRVLELGALFAAPLVSVIEADVLAAREFANFLFEFGFVQDGSSTDAPETRHLGSLRTVTFAYKSPGPNGALQDSVMEIPLLSLVPLPLLQVTDAEFAFQVRVLESQTDALGAAPPLLNAPQALAADGTPAAPSSPQVSKPRIRAMLASGPSPSSTQSHSSQNSLDANMSVKLSMKQADVPAGISAMLQLMGQAVNSTTSRKE